MIYCIILYGNYPLTPEQNISLFRAGCLCLGKKLKSYKFSNKDFTVEVETKFEEDTFVGITGVRFDGEVHSDKGSSKIKFILNTGDFKRAKKESWYKDTIRASGDYQLN